MEFKLPELLCKLAPVDLVIVEGFKRDAHPKLEVYRAEVGKSFIHPIDPEVFAVASDRPLPDAGVSVLDLNDPESIADVMLREAMPLQLLLEKLNAVSAEIG